MFKLNTAVAQAEVSEEEEKRSSPSASVGMDLFSAYYFRGIVQNTEGVNLQPYMEAGFPLYQKNAVTLGLDLGIWNSFHPSNLAPPDATVPRAWYEADLYPALSLDIGDVGVGIAYTAYTSPNGSFATVHELSLSLGYDDSGIYKNILGGRFKGVQPGITLAQELDGTAFGDHEGTYLQISIEPSCAMVEGQGFSLDLLLPVWVGLSLGDYFELIDPVSGDSEDDTLGAVSLGATLAAGLGFIPERIGVWTLSTGAQVLLLDSNLETANQGDGVAYVASGGLATEY